MPASSTVPSRPQFRRWLVRGTVILLPSLVTLMVIGFVVNFLSSVLDPLVRGARLVDPDAPAAVIELLALCLLVAGAVAVGYAADRRSTDRIGRRFHQGVESVPGIGQVYATFNQMTDLLSGEGAEAFREVKVVEFPNEGTYVLGFLTAETPSAIADPVDGAGMVTLFVPMAPNPVMGGFVVHVRPERVHDTPLTVEQGIQSIVTSGVAAGTEDEMERSSTEAGWDDRAE